MSFYDPFGFGILTDPFSYDPFGTTPGYTGYGGGYPAGYGTTTTAAPTGGIGGITGAGMLELCVLTYFIIIFEAFTALVEQQNVTCPLIVVMTACTCMH